MRSTLFTVIPILNLKDDTLECLASLARAGQQPGQVVIVDNGSTDGSVEAIRATYGEPAAVISHPENVGFAQACNEGFEAAVERGAEWILLLNNDTIVAEDFFEAIQQAIDADLPYRIYAPAIMYYSERETVWHLGSYQIPGTLIWQNRDQGKAYDPSWPEVIPVDSICGCAMLIHRSVYQQIGLFTPSLIAYWEEVEFCWRAALAGFQMAILTQARMWHKVARTMGKHNPRARFLQTRNQLRFYRVFAHGLQKPLMYLFFILKLVTTLLSDLLAGRTDLIKPALAGARDGWRGT